MTADHPDKANEIGSESNPAAYIDMLLSLTAEWGRVLALHGSIAIELGDTYSGSGGAGGDYNEGGLRKGQARFDGSQSRAYGTGAAGRPPRNGMVGGAWPRAKSLALIPQLYAVALAYGINPLTGNPSPAGRWLVRNVIVWHRPNPAVGALGDKVRPSTSYIVIATRSPKRWFDLTAVRTPSDYDRPNLRGLGSRLNGTPDGQTHNASDHTVNAAGAPPLDTWLDPYDGTHDTWTLTTQPSPLAHCAMWPAKLAERLILMMCPHEVCRVCGEPRRRVEGKAEYVPSATPGTNVSRRAERSWVSEISAGRAAHSDKPDGGYVRTAPTLGWTNCLCGERAWVDLENTRLKRDYRPGVVLDPFVGSGTTICVADLHGRDGIGIDFDPRNREILPRRMEEVKRALFGTMPELPGQGDLFAEVPA